jgi:hypothetical protein
MTSLSRRRVAPFSKFHFFYTQRIKPCGSFGDCVPANIFNRHLPRVKLRPIDSLYAAPTSMTEYWQRRSATDSSIDARAQGTMCKHASLAYVPTPRHEEQVHHLPSGGCDQWGNKDDSGFNRQTALHEI